MTDFVLSMLKAEARAAHPDGGCLEVFFCDHSGTQWRPLSGVLAASDRLVDGAHAPPPMLIVGLHPDPRRVAVDAVSEFAKGVLDWPGCRYVPLSSLTRDTLHRHVDAAITGACAPVPASLSVQPAQIAATAKAVQHLFVSWNVRAGLWEMSIRQAIAAGTPLPLSLVHSRDPLSPHQHAMYSRLLNYARRYSGRERQHADVLEATIDAYLLRYRALHDATGVAKVTMDAVIAGRLIEAYQSARVAAKAAGSAAGTMANP